MKLIYIANVRMPTEKAHGVQIVKTCEAFSLKSIDTQLIVPWRFNRLKEDTFEYYNIRGRFKITKIPSFDLVCFGRTGFWIQSLSFSLFVFFYLFFKKTDIIYSRDETPLFGLLFFKKRIFWEAHTNRYNYFVKSLIKRCAGIVAITDGLKDFYVNKGILPNKIIVVPDGIDLADFSNKLDKISIRKELGLPMDKKIALYVGRLDGWKGVETFLEASKILPENIKAVIIGGEPQQISRLKKEYEEVVFLGFLPYRELAKNQKAADVLIIPNTGKDEISAKFTSPLKLFAYMASGRPIVASNLPSLREVLNDENACFFEADNAQSLASSIVSLLNDEEKQDKISEQSLRDIIKYSWNCRAQKIMSFIGVHFKNNVSKNYTKKS